MLIHCSEREEGGEERVRRRLKRTGRLRRLGTQARRMTARGPPHGRVGVGGVVERHGSREAEGGGSGVLRVARDTRRRWVVVHCGGEAS